MKKRYNVKRMVMLAFFVAMGVVISPILRVEGCCPMQHFINVTCAVIMGPVDAFICALMIGVIRMTTMAIPPLALTGAVFGAALSGILYRLSKGKIICAVLGEVIGTGIIGAMVSYPIMRYVMGRGGLSLFFYIPSFITGTIMGGAVAYVFLVVLKKGSLLERFKSQLEG